MRQGKSITSINLRADVRIPRREDQEGEQDGSGRNGSLDVLDKEQQLQLCIDKAKNAELEAMKAYWAVEFGEMIRLVRPGSPLSYTSDDRDVVEGDRPQQNRKRRLLTLQSVGNKEDGAGNGNNSTCGKSDNPNIDDPPGSSSPTQNCTRFVSMTSHITDPLHMKQSSEIARLLPRKSDMRIMERTISNEDESAPPAHALAWVLNTVGYKEYNLLFRLLQTDAYEKPSAELNSRQTMSNQEDKNSEGRDSVESHEKSLEEEEEDMFVTFAVETWKILQALPTNPITLSKIRTLRPVKHQNPGDWRAIFDWQSCYQLLYHLQIVDAFMNAPAKIDDHEEEGAKEKLCRTAFCLDLVQYGGVEHLITVLRKTQFHCRDDRGPDNTSRGAGRSERGDSVSSLVSVSSFGGSRTLDYGGAGYQARLLCLAVLFKVLHKVLSMDPTFCDATKKRGEGREEDCGKDVDSVRANKILREDIADNIPEGFVLSQINFTELIPFIFDLMYWCIEGRFTNDDIKAGHGMELLGPQINPIYGAAVLQYGLDLVDGCVRADALARKAFWQYFREVSKHDEDRRSDSDGLGDGGMRVGMRKWVKYFLIRGHEPMREQTARMLLRICRSSSCIARSRDQWNERIGRSTVESRLLLGLLMQLKDESCTRQYCNQSEQYFETLCILIMMEGKPTINSSGSKSNQVKGVL